MTDSEKRAAVKLQPNGGVAFKSADNSKRYFYFRSLEDVSDKHLIILMYNPSSLTGLDRTIEFIENVCKHHGYGHYYVVNLIPKRGGDPKLIDADSNELNLEIISRLLDNSNASVWVGWGQLVKGKANALFPTKLRNLLRNHATRIIRVQITPDKHDGKYPVHPSRLANYLHFPAEETVFVPFDVTYIDSY